MNGIKRLDSGFTIRNGWQVKYEPTKTRRTCIEALSSMRRDGAPEGAIEEVERQLRDGVH